MTAEILCAISHLNNHTLDKEDYRRISEALSFLMSVVEKHYDKEGQRIAISVLMHSLTLQQYITSQFPKLLERNGFRKIRFHDLRYSCANLLLAGGVPMKHIQEWLGHSDFATTVNIYADLDYSSKLASASAMESNFHLGV